MSTPSHYIAQMNIAWMRAPLDNPIMEGFVSQLEAINAIADASPGFVWRLQTDEGNARLTLLAEEGPTPGAFTFVKRFPAPELVSSEQ